MKKLFTFLIALVAFSFVTNAQCPDCNVDETVHPSTGNEDYGLFPENITVQAGVDTTIVFQFLMPVNLDVSGISATVETVQILDVVDLPPNTNLDWICDQDANGCNYEPQNYRFGCVTVCLNTLALPGTYTINVDVYGTGQAAGISQGQSLPIPIDVTVLPADGNPFFSMNTNVGCGDVNLDLEQTLPEQLFINPVSYAWVVDGDTVSGEMANYLVSGVGTHSVELIETIEEYYISDASITVTDNSCYCGDIEEPNYPFVGCTADPDVYLTMNGGNGSSTTSTETGGMVSWSGLDVPITDLAISIQAFDYDELSGNDDLGSFLTSITQEPTVGSENFSTSCTNGFYTIDRRVKIVNSYFDSVVIYAPSMTPMIANLSGNNVFCAGDSVVLQSSIAEYYQWHTDTGAIAGATSQTFVAYDGGTYYMSAIDAGSICPSELSTGVTLSYGAVDIPAIVATEEGLVVANPNGYSVQWFSNGIPMPGETTDTLMNLTSQGPFNVSFTSNTGCSAMAVADFEICLSGAAIASNTTLSTGDEVSLYTENFILTNGNSVSWAISTEADGPVVDMTTLQASIDNNWVFPSTNEDTINLTCSQFGQGSANYYVTPFSTQFFDAGCVPDGSFCIEITGTDWEIVGSSLVFQFPDGSEVEVLEELVPAEFQNLIPENITPAVLALLPQLLPDGLCFNLSDLYQGDPNGDWIISAQNVGTGDVTVTIPQFEVAVYDTACSSVMADEFTTISSVSSTITGNSSNELTVAIDAPSYAAPFPTVMPNCNVFGEAKMISVDCVTAIEDVIDTDKFNLYPNPNNGLFTIEMDVKKATAMKIEIVDVTGRIIMNRNVEANQGAFSESFDLKNNLQAGFYILNVKVGAEQVQKHFVVQ